jgi:hypothetical protein
MASGSEKVGAGGSGGSKGSTKSSGRAKNTPRQGGINSNNPVPF